MRNNLLIVIFLVLTSNILAQNIKDHKISFKYIQLPQTPLDKSIKTNLVIYSGISDPRKFSEGIKNNNRKILKNFILHDHEEIDEKKASAILCAASKKTVDIVTTEKDHARLRNSPKGSQREKLFLISKLAKIVISTDEKLLIKFLASNLKIKLN